MVLALDIVLFILITLFLKITNIINIYVYIYIYVYITRDIDNVQSQYVLRALQWIY